MVVRITVYIRTSLPSDGILISATLGQKIHETILANVDTEKHDTVSYLLDGCNYYVIDKEMTFEMLGTHHRHVFIVS